MENCIWVAMDYVDIIVHIFLPDARDFYSLESLWQDAPITEVPDLD
jgi:ribosome-associated protein